MSSYKSMIFKMKAYLFLLSSILMGCDPITIIGSGCGVGTLATRDKGVSGVVSDSKLSLEIKAKIYKYKCELDSLVTVNVQNSEVFLTGQVPDSNDKTIVEKLAWETKGVKRVINELHIDSEKKLSDTISDSCITTKIKSMVLFKPEIRSLNYSIKTVQGVVYITGTSQNEAERNLVVEISRSVPNVKKVICYTTLSNPNEM